MSFSDDALTDAHHRIRRLARAVAAELAPVPANSGEREYRAALARAVVRIREPPTAGDVGPPAAEELAGWEWAVIRLKTVFGAPPEEQEHDPA